MQHLVQPTLDFIAAHSSWVVVVLFVTVFGESFAFIGLLFPGASLLSRGYPDGGWFAALFPELVARSSTCPRSPGS
jgi:hypothetical protein